MTTPAPITVLATPEVSDLAAGLVSVLNKLAGNPSDRSLDRSAVWNALLRDGWDQLGTLSGATSSDARRGLIEFARVVGRFLPEIALSSTWVLRTDEAEAASRPPFVVAVPRRNAAGMCRVPYAAGAGAEVVNLPGRHVALSADEDEFVPTLAMFAVKATPDAVAPESLESLALVWSAECLGAAETVFQMSVEYAKIREQFGRPVGSFQALKHMLADALVGLEAATSALVWAANESEFIEPALRLVVDRCRYAVEVGGQVHGGIGMTWELGLHFYVRHILALRDLIEDVLAWRSSVG